MIVTACICLGGVAALLSDLSGAQLQQSQMVRNALRRSDIPLEKTEPYTGIDSRQFAREIDGHAGTFRRFWALPRRFRQWLWFEGWRLDGFPEEIERYAALGLQKHMAKASMSVRKIS